MSPASGKPRPIWKLQWSAGVKDKALLVRYCALQFAGDKKTHRVALNAPKIVPPLPIDFDTGMARGEIGQRLPPARPGDDSFASIAFGQVDAEIRDQIMEPKPRGGRPVRGKPAELIAWRHGANEGPYIRIA